MNVQDPPTTRPQATRSAEDLVFTPVERHKWASLGTAADMTADSAAASEPPDPRRLVATGEPVAQEEIDEIYRPLAQLLGVLATGKRHRQQAVDGFLGRPSGSSPFIVAIAGSVAVGKSTAARVLQWLLRRAPGGPSVDLLPTDGFLYPNGVLEARGLMGRKGFPESYDQSRLIDTLAAVRAGQPEVTTPVYSHLAYDIVPEARQVLRSPDVLIVEGLNVLQVNTQGASRPEVVVSDFFDFSIYVDAEEEVIARWFAERLLTLRATVLRQPDSYFHRLSQLSEQEVLAVADQIWRDINLVNLRQNVVPTRGRAHLILHKAADHRVERLLLRRP